MSQIYRPILVACGFLSLALGVIGIFLPLLPTTPFLLLSAFCFSKGSERWHAWLMRQPHIGPAIDDWNRHGVIRPKAKVMCLSCMALTLVYTVGFATFPIYGRVTVLLICSYVAVFVATRPSRA
ncbi:MAG: YbaN family protein [Oligoflexia bacterium]